MHDRTVALPSRPVDVFVAAKGVADETGEPMITIGFGKDLAGSEFLAVSIDDALRLHRLGSPVLDVVIFDDDQHWWSLHELTAGTTEWHLPKSEVAT